MFIHARGEGRNFAGELRQRIGDEPAVLQRLAVLEFTRGYYDEAFELTEQLV